MNPLNPNELISLILSGRKITYNADFYPYTLGKFKNMFHEKKFGNPTKIGIVWGTSRHNPINCKHAGYISDSMYIPEIIQKFQKLNGEVIFNSFLDIDLKDEDIGEYNFILCGDGEVNCIVTRLLELIGEGLEIKYDMTNGPFFNDKNSRVINHMYGVVQILKNPWNEDRFILQLGGIGPIGTVSSLKWLNDKLDITSKVPNSPFVIVKGEEKGYSLDFRGYENHCEKCCKVEEIIDKEKKVYWKGKISNVTTVVKIYPL